MSIRVVMAATLALAVFAVDLTAWATGTSRRPSKFTQWTCTLDLEAASRGAVPPGVMPQVSPNNTEKICGSGNSKRQQMDIKCKGKFEDWSTGVRTYLGFPCQISRSQCGGTGFVTTTRSSLLVSKTGDAILACRYN